jgi:hypothetical protein
MTLAVTANGRGVGRWRGGLIGDLCCCIIREGVNL